MPYGKRVGLNAQQAKRGSTLDNVYRTSQVRFRSHYLPAVKWQRRNRAQILWGKQGDNDHAFFWLLTNLARAKLQNGQDLNEVGNFDYLGLNTFITELILFTRIYYLSVQKSYCNFSLIESHGYRGSNQVGLPRHYKKDAAVFWL